VRFTTEKVKKMAMESTSIYRVPIWDILYEYESPSSPEIDDLQTAV
jgi:hypothetical protein